VDVAEHLKVPGRRLGLRPADLSRPLLKFADLRTGVAPEHPLTADHFSGVTYGLYKNDQLGDCGPTMIANIRRAITKILGGRQVDPTQADVFDLYSRSTNPPFDPKTGANDNGVVLADMLSALLKGGIGGVKPIAYAAVNVKDLDEVRAAISIFGALALGVDLDVAQQEQTDNGLWDYARSAEWGGHAVPTLGYTSAAKGRDFTVPTWAQLVGMTDAFWAKQVQEAFVIIWPEHLGTKQFQQGIDMPAANAAYTAVTGKPGPFPSAPKPTPGPVQDADEIFAGQLHAWLDSRPRCYRPLQDAASAWLVAKHL
jgi:hypothetical protein